jgi:hypothetical protein
MEALLNIAGARGGAGGGFLGAHDAERLIESLRDFEVDDVGSARWTEQRESLERLNVQAHHNAVTHSDEFVKEFLVSHDKVKTLVRELLVAEVWKEKVYPLFDDEALSKGVVATEVYLAHHHEATLCNLLEITFFHKDACEAAGDDALLELTDYCVRKLVYLVGEGDAVGSCAAADVKASLAALNDDATVSLSRTAKEELEEKTRETRFAIAMCALTVLRYVTDNMGDLPLGVMARLLDTHDAQSLLAPLLDKRPWVRKRKDTKSGSVVSEAFQDGRWQVVPREDRMQLTKCDGQTWLALTNLVCDPKCRARYRYTDSRKRSMERLKRHFNDVLFDQLPVLQDLQRAVDEVLLMVTPSAHEVTAGRLILEQVPETRDALLRRSDEKWRALAATQLATHFADSQANRDAARRRAEDMSEVFEFMMQMEEQQKAQRAGSRKEKGDPPPPKNVARVEFSRRAPDAAEDDDTWYRWHVADFEVDQEAPCKEVCLTLEDGSGFELKGDRRKLKPPRASAATAAPPAMSERAKEAVAAAKAASSATPAPHDGKVTVTFGTACAEALLDLPAPGRVRADVSGGGGGVDRGTAGEEAEALAAMAALPNAMWVTVGLLARDGFALQLKLKKTPGVHEAYRCAKTGVYWVYEPSGGFLTTARK